MPTYRKLHTKIIDSYDFAEMPDDFTRVFWMLLIVTVDSEGRAIDNPAWLRSKMFPLRDDVKLQQIEQSMLWLDARGMVVRYQVDGRRYFYIVKFKEYQSGTEREAKSVLPAPISTHEEVMSNSGVNQELPRPGVVVVVNESVNASVCVNTFEAYEKEIGIISPKIADELKQLEQEYPAEWIVEAFGIAAKANKRNLRYVEGVLHNWRVDGKSPPKVNGAVKQDTTPVEIILPGGQVVEAKR